MKPYIIIRVEKKELSKNGKVLKFRDLQRAFEYMLETLNSKGQTSNSYTKYIKFVIVGRYETEISYACIRDCAIDVGWCPRPKRLKDKNENYT